MLLLYYTHSIFFYLGLPAFQNDNFNTNLHSFDYDYLPQEVCVAKCLEHKEEVFVTTENLLYRGFLKTPDNQSLKICLDTCETIKATSQLEDDNLPDPKQVYENYSLKLICRDDTSLNFNIELHARNKNQTTPNQIFANSSLGVFTANETEINQHEYETVFVIKIHLANDADKIFVYLSDEKFFTIDQLMANTSYNISVLAVHSNNQYSVIAQQQQFKTLRRGYTPGNVTEIKIIHFTEDKFNRKHLTATLTWKPAADMTCHYSIICFSPESEDYDLQPLEIRNPRQLYKHQLENLTFSSVYKVGIRASNTKSMRESELFWKTFTVPSCVEWHNYNFNICAPEAPQNLYVEQIIVDEHIYSLNISWQLPTHLPDNYTLRIQDLSLQGEATIYQLSKDLYNYFIPKIHFYGVFYEVSLTAYTRGGHTTASFTDITKTVVHMPEKNPFVKLIAVILAPIFCVAILSLTIFIIYHRRAKLKRYQQRCKYFEELEKKAPIDPKNNFDLAANLIANPNDLSYQIEAEEHKLYDDDMEIDPNDLILYQVLGEGAFGLVKLGLYKDSKLGTTQQVAVKMLKDRPSGDDIYAFRREIEVMKSVEKHPNIVGIIGHCTRFSNQMMLITEYCSLGNLLNFLRDEWHFLHKIQTKKPSINMNIEYVELNQDELQQSIEKEEEEEEKNTKNNLQYNNDKYDISANQDANDAVESFEIKYNGINVVMPKSYVVKNHDNSHNKSDIIKLRQKQFKHVEDLNDASSTSTETQTEIERGETKATGALYSAAENKSYGYHGFCTNSCKCNVEIIHRTNDLTEIGKQNDDVQLLGGQQQQQQQQNLNKSCTNTKIQIKNCDCKMKEKYHDNTCSRKYSGAVENKSYFKLFTTDSKHLSNKNRKNIQKTKQNHKIKRELPTASNTDRNENDDDDGDGDNCMPLSSIHLNRVPLSSEDLLNIARQVAVGMDFLAKNKVVHRDLAARNVLVAPDRTIKIADFGLSRDVYQENMYKKTGNGKLPIKWLALESMTHQVYTTQSDVWSYGILLYEIVTLGATPYPSIPTNRLLHLLKSGYRMEKPKGCDQTLYNLMYACWNAEPIARPTFNKIIQELNEMINCVNNSRNYATIYFEVNKDLTMQHDRSKTNEPSDESYLKPQ